MTLTGAFKMTCTISHLVPCNCVNKCGTFLSIIFALAKHIIIYSSTSTIHLFMGTLSFVDSFCSRWIYLYISCEAEAFVVNKPGKTTPSNHLHHA